MHVTEMNTGEKIPYIVNGSVIALNGSELSIDCCARQKDMAVFIDIFWAQSGALQEASGDAYAANILIPPWVEQEIDTGVLDDDGHQIYARQRDLLDMANVTLQLWAIPSQYKVKEEE